MGLISPMNYSNVIHKWFCRLDFDFYFGADLSLLIIDENHIKKTTQKITSQQINFAAVKEEKKISLLKIFLFASN
jgi:hypothetical protein